MSRQIKNLMSSFLCFSTVHRKTCEKKVLKTGVFRSQHRILMYISQNQYQSQKDIAKAMDVSTATIAISIKKLQKGGYIKKSTDLKDNRFNQIELTEKGKEIVKLSYQIFDEIEQNLFKGFSESEIDNLIGYFKRMTDNLLDMNNKKEGVIDNE